MAEEQTCSICGSQYHGRGWAVGDGKDTRVCSEACVQKARTALPKPTATERTTEVLSWLAVIGIAFLLWWGCGAIQKCFLGLWRLLLK